MNEPSREDLIAQAVSLIGNQQNLLTSSALTLGQILGTLSRGGIVSDPVIEGELNLLRKAMAAQEGIFKRTYDYLDYLKDRK